MFGDVKWSIRYRMVDVASTTEFRRLESGTASNRYQWDIVRASIGMPISNLKERETLAQKWQQMLYRISPSYRNTFHGDRKAKLLIDQHSYLEMAG